MAWQVEVSDEFVAWYRSLDELEGISVDTAVDMLVEYGPTLGRPHADTLKGSVYPNLKELRIQHLGRPIRILFAFDPRQNAYLILGGDKSGNKSWYRDAIRRAEAIYSQHLKEIGE
ncbi:MAG: type II toxin-antitoxin system RelE/ParE family toxin [Terracidiphilus sp.]